MAFHIWNIEKDNAHRITDVHQAIFGCRTGMIPKWVQSKYSDQKIRGGDGFQWSLLEDDIRGFLGQAYETDNGTLVIWANPKDEHTITWYRVVAIAGDSGYNRTVMMALLHNWATEIDRTSRTERQLNLSATPEVLMTFWYTNGDFHVDGGIKGRWTLPGPGSTNSVFIWPNTMRFFREVFPAAFSTLREKT